MIIRTIIIVKTIIPTIFGLFSSSLALVEYTSDLCKRVVSDKILHLFKMYNEFFISVQHRHALRKSVTKLESTSRSAQRDKQKGNY